MIDLTHKETAFALAAVRDAMPLARRVQAELVHDKLEKRDRSPVTVADYGVQALIGRALAAHDPAAVLVGEESSDELRAPEAAPVLERATAFVKEDAPEATPQAVCDWIARGGGRPGARFWTLDPIDGTKGFLRRAHYAIAFALIEDGVVQVAALGCPSLNRDASPSLGDGAIVVARRGEGAWLHAEGARPGAFQALHVSNLDQSPRARLFRSVEAGHTNEADIEAFEKHLGLHGEPVSMDSQAKYAVLSAGHGELLVRFLSADKPDYRECIWDQAAGSLILEEAGGRITDLHGRRLDFAQGRTLASNEGIFASNGLLHELGLKAIAAIRGQ